MPFRIRKSFGAGPARFTVGRRGGSGSLRFGRARLNASRRGFGVSFRILPGVTFTKRLLRRPPDEENR